MRSPAVGVMIIKYDINLLTIYLHNLSSNGMRDFLTPGNPDPVDRSRDGSPREQAWRWAFTGMPKPASCHSLRHSFTTP